MYWGQRHGLFCRQLWTINWNQWEVVSLSHCLGQQMKQMTGIHHNMIIYCVWTELNLGTLGHLRAATKPCNSYFYHMRICECLSFLDVIKSICCQWSLAHCVSRVTDLPAFWLNSFGIGILATQQYITSCYRPKHTMQWQSHLDRPIWRFQINYNGYRIDWLVSLYVDLSFSFRRAW